MRRSLPRLAAIVGLSLAFAASAITPVLARGPGGGAPHGFSKGQKTGWHGAKVPPGWSKGKKVGWGTNRTSPPGWR